MTQRNQKGSEAELHPQAEPAREPTVKEVTEKYEAKLKVSAEAYAVRGKEIQKLQAEFDSLDTAYQKLQAQHKTTKRGRKRWKKKYTQLCIRNVETAQ